MMTSNKPYIIRAFYDWILDNNVTPYLAVDATLPYVEIPEEYVTEGKILLNIEPSAIRQLAMGNEWISFSTRFNSVSYSINIPIGSVIAIYARENGHGIEFVAEPLKDNPFPREDAIKRESKNEESPLTVISANTKSSSKTQSKKRNKKNPGLTIVE